VWGAIRELGAERIGHATRTVEDPRLMDFMAERRVGIEANLTSNVQTNTIPSYEHHPLRSFLERGLLATISTDNPTTSAITLAYEYEVAAPAAGLDEGLARRARANALEVAFLGKEEKAVLGKREP
jgi:adenosine deaminase